MVHASQALYSAYIGLCIVHVRDKNKKMRMVLFIMTILIPAVVLAVSALWYIVGLGIN